MKKALSALKGALTFVGPTVVNLLWVYVGLELTRLVFLWVNFGLFNLSWQSFWLISRGGLLFDTATVFYVNLLWLAMVWLPLHLKERRSFHLAEKIVFVAFNSIAFGANLADTAFFAFRQHRTTSDIFTEFGGDGNIGTIMLRGAAENWYLVLVFALLAVGLWKLYVPVRQPQSCKQYYVAQSVGLAFWITVAFWGMRGCTFSAVTRPIAIGYAQRFAKNPEDVDLVLNTPFSMIRTTVSAQGMAPKFYDSEAELLAIYTPVHQPGGGSGVLKGKNVVFLVLESFSREFVGALNDFEGFTPFLDELYPEVVTFEHTFSNSGFSIDALPSLLASTPRMGDKSFVVSPFAVNHITGLGDLLGAEGYHTAWFHGAENESLGLQAFVRSAGFKHYYGMTEYYAAKGQGADFDGTWGILDEPFLQYFAEEISTMPQPFLAGVFTLSSHHPFDLPKDVEKQYFKDGRTGIQATVAYTDHALREFFATAQKQPWFANTVFIISADHAFLNEPTHKQFNNEMGRMMIPIFIYDPSGTLRPGVREGIMQQIDVLPTLLGLLGYDKPYFAFGNDVMQTPAHKRWGLRWNHVPQLTDGRYVLQLETQTWQPSHMYDFTADPYLQHDLINHGLPEQTTLERKLKAILQTYTDRERADQVRI